MEPATHPPPRQVKFQMFLRSVQVSEIITFADWKQYERIGARELGQVLICKKEKTAGCHAEKCAPPPHTEKNAASSVGAFAKSADASRSLTHGGGAYRSGNRLELRCEAVGMPHKRQLVATEIGPGPSQLSPQAQHPPSLDEYSW